MSNVLENHQEKVSERVFFSSSRNGFSHGDKKRKTELTAIEFYDKFQSSVSSNLLEMLSKNDFRTLLVNDTSCRNGKTAVTFFPLDGPFHTIKSGQFFFRESMGQMQNRIAHNAHVVSCEDAKNHVETDARPLKKNSDFQST